MASEGCLRRCVHLPLLRRERKETDVMLKVGDDNLDIRDEGEQMFEVQGIYMHAAYDRKHQNFSYNFTGNRERQT